MHQVVDGQHQFAARLANVFAGRQINRLGHHPAVTFECGLLKHFQSGAMTAPAALTRIAAAKRRAEKVRQLPRLLGENAEKVALTKRYSRMMAKPIDLS